MQMSSATINDVKTATTGAAFLHTSDMKPGLAGCRAMNRPEFLLRLERRADDADHHRQRKADPDIDWPIARLTFDDAGHITHAVAYCPSLPAGEHDVWCIPVARSAHGPRAPADLSAS